MTAPAPAPDMIEFQGSSTCRIATREHSIPEKQKHQVANCPPKTGALSIVLNAPALNLRLIPDKSYK